MIISFDVDFNQLNEVQAYLKLNQIEIVKFVENGPAGGNPRFTVLVDHKESAQLIIDLYFG